MKNLKAMKGSFIKGGQKGFTIIELVVVILLLGILTATALPRFIDVTEDAKDAVREATIGGLRTGMALYRAQSIAQGLASGGIPTAGDYTLAANASGYPLYGPADNCTTIYQGLLQTGYTAGVGANASTTGCEVTLTEVGRSLFFDTLNGEVYAL